MDLHFRFLSLADGYEYNRNGPEDVWLIFVVVLFYLGPTLVHSALCGSCSFWRIDLMGKRRRSGDLRYQRVMLSHFL